MPSWLQAWRGRARHFKPIALHGLAVLFLTGSFLQLSVDAFAAQPTIGARWRVLAQPVGSGGETVLALDVTLEPGWHVNAHQPTRAYLIPTDLQINPGENIDVVDIRYPEPVLRTIASVGGAPLQVYEGRFAIEVRLRGSLPRDLSARLRYQACSDETCLPPKTMQVSFSGISGPEGGRGGAEVATPRIDLRFEDWMRDFGLPATLGIALLLGLGLNLTPCVYPLISITVAYFGGQSRHAPRRLAMLAVTYVIGIAVTFSVLGVAAALSGGFFGAALQKPAVLAGIGGLLIVLAASNFGFYQFRLPALLVQRAGRATTGVPGALVMGLTMGIVAAPCVGPVVLGLLLFVATRQDALLGFMLFFSLAVGMGLPYLGLAMAAGSLTRLPRSGEWLAWTERLFGFVLLGMAVYFLAPLLGERVASTAMPLLVAVAGIYLGFMDSSARTLVPFVALKRLVGITALVLAVWLAVSKGRASAVGWVPFSPAALSAAHAAGKPAVVDFTASWCLPCRENDAVTFTDPGVGEQAHRFVMLRADVTEATLEAEEWMKRYQVLGVPTILFYGSDGREQAREVGFVEPRRLEGVLQRID